MSVFVEILGKYALSTKTQCGYAGPETGFGVSPNRPNLRKRFFLPDYDARVYYSDDAQTYLHLDRVSCAVCRFDCSSALLADSVRPSYSQSESDSLWPDDGRDQLFLRWRALCRAGSGPHCWTRTAVSLSLDACCEGQFRGQHLGRRQDGTERSAPTELQDVSDRRQRVCACRHSERRLLGHGRPSKYDLHRLVLCENRSCRNAGNCVARERPDGAFSRKRESGRADRRLERVHVHAQDRPGSGEWEQPSRAYGHVSGNSLV